MIPTLFRPVSFISKLRRAASFRLSLEESTVSPIHVHLRKGFLAGITAYPDSIHLDKMTDEIWYLWINFSDGSRVHVSLMSGEKIKVWASSFDGRVSAES